MALLYRLQKGALDRNKGPRISYDSLVKSRDIFRADWRSYIDLLQLCHTYSRDFTMLCEFANTRSSSECSAFSKGMVEMAREIYEDVSRIQAKHQRTYHEIRTYAFPGVIMSSMDERAQTYQGELYIHAILFWPLNHVTESIYRITWWWW